MGNILSRRKQRPTGGGETINFSIIVSYFLPVSQYGIRRGRVIEQYSAVHRHWKVVGSDVHKVLFNRYKPLTNSSVQRRMTLRQDFRQQIDKKLDRLK